MKPQTTTEAFKQLIYSKTFTEKHKETGKQYLFQLRMRFKKGKLLSERKIEELLKKEGYTVKTEKTWVKK